VDGRGRRFVTPKAIDPREDADGRTVWLSIDLVIQGRCEQALDRLMAEWGPMGAVAIVLDPANGDVLAMAQRPGFDPSATNQVAGRNLATQWTTEVGSTFKPVTASRALALGLVGLEETFSLPRERTFTAGRAFDTIRDSHDGGERVEGGTLVEVLAQSNNPDSAELAWRIGQDGMRRLITDLAIEKPFPLIGYGREAQGWVRWKRFGAFDHLRLGFGHSMAMTPLRLASIFCAFARDDFAPVTPRLVLAVGGEAVPDLATGPALVTDPAHRDLLRRALRAVVTDGTGKKAVLSEKYEIAGKTGTAKKPDAFGRDAYFSASFLGYAPADRPRLVCLVMAQEPRSKADGSKPYGGAVAGPAVRYVLERTLEEYLGVPTKTATAAVPAAEQAPLRAVPDPEEAGR
jgi:cell division protein FtsI/penicillin-binding protein 2